jgi:hypothetical protein
MEYSDSMLRSCITVKVERYCLVIDRMHTFLDVSPDGNVVESRNCTDSRHIFQNVFFLGKIYIYIYVYTFNMDVLTVSTVVTLLQFLDSTTLPSGSYPMHDLE